MNKLILVSLTAIIFILIDLYVFQAVKSVISNWRHEVKLIVGILFWGLTLISIAGLFIYHFGDPQKVGRLWRNFIMVMLFVNYFSKLFAVIVLFVDDIVRAVKWIVSQFNSGTKVEKIATEATGSGISRSEFLTRTAIVAAAVPAMTMGYGIVSGAHDYRIRRSVVKLPNLPAAFDGIKIAQLSDIHSGSFFNKTAVKGGVEMLMAEKPDVVFFTGDLVNNTADEVKNYINIFDKLKAPLGVYSTLGNHDYGDYYNWSSERAKIKNLEDLKEAHGLMGWKLLMNENKLVTLNGDSLAIIGVENWGKGGFVKHGRLDKAVKGTEEAAVKLLLSHDPSHWDAQVRQDYKDIDLMFAGHTHGFQFGVELGNFRWSPSQYLYKQWAGLYQQENQYLYVNRGFGFLGFPGRIGILPEITILELHKA